jgi:phospholipase C
MKHLVLSGCLAAAFAGVTAGVLADDDSDGRRGVLTATPIKHLVVIFQENISFDHYFGTYPNAQNNPGETPFHARPHTPTSINSLLTPLDTTNHFVPLVGVDLLHANPNAIGTNPVAPNNQKSNGVNASNPIRLSPAQALTADQGHNDSPEQAAYNNGHMDGFPAWVGTAGPPPAGFNKKLVMGYFDGNTVTALWNYAQHFAMNDNSYVTTFGPSSPGAINLIAGQTNGFSTFVNVVSGGASLHATHEVPDGNGNFTLIGDGDPLGDVCSNTTIDQVTMAGRNIGDLLNAKGITWGWFEGGFDLTIVNPAQPPLNPTATTGCNRTTVPAAPGTPAFISTDYIPHHQPFQYYASTSNPKHRRPSSVEAIGHSLIPHTSMPDLANHQYDSHDFFDALAAHNLPAVSFLKAPAFQDGHAGYSDPLDEQNFLVKTINTLQQSEVWESTAVVILYDDSDGWYDHQMPPIVNPSFVGTFPAIPPLTKTVDTLNGPALCNNGFQQGTPTPATPLLGTAGAPVQGRCGYGTRSPLLVISPFAKVNHVDHTLTDQSSVLRFIEDNWLSGERIQPGGSFDTIAGPLNNMFDFDRHEEGEARKVILDPATGAVVSISAADGDEHRD